MNIPLKRLIEDKLDLFTEYSSMGVRIDQQEIRAFNALVNYSIPDWYIELVCLYPLSGRIFRYIKDDQIFELKWSSLSSMRMEMLEAYPGIDAVPLGYINVGTDVTGGGDPFFIPIDHSDNPPLYQVPHDMDIAEYGVGGFILVADSLIEFFEKALVT